MLDTSEKEDSASVGKLDLPALTRPRFTSVPPAELASRRRDSLLPPANVWPCEVEAALARMAGLRDRLDRLVLFRTSTTSLVTLFFSFGFRLTPIMCLSSL